MSIYQLMKKMRLLRKQYKLTAVEQALYYELLAICNQQRWPGYFACSNKQLCNALDISERSLIRIRKSLIVAGLIEYKSGRSAHITGTYSMIDDKRGDKNNNNDDITDDKNNTETGDTESDIIIHNTKIPPLVPNEREIYKLKYKIQFDDIKNQLLADEKWKKDISMQSGMYGLFIPILPQQVDLFLRYIVITGEEYTLLTLSDAKRRFYWWWTNHGKKAYEEKNGSTVTHIW